MAPTASTKRSGINRRSFLEKSAATAVGASLTLEASAAFGVHTSTDHTIRIGLVGCGGRGSGAAVNALRADPQTRLVAMADVFADRIEGSLNNLKKTNVAQRVDVPPERRFVGFNAYAELLQADVDLVLLATPPHFRPQHLRACVDAGKHVFAEKPVAVDGPGVRRVLEATEAARSKNLMLVSGLCWRYETGMQQMVDRIHQGGVGRIVSLESVRYHPGVGKLAKRRPEWTDMEYQLRNWYYFTWLSGDFVVEQFVHELDKQAWVMGNTYPTRCTATGGRQTRIEPWYGNIYDHFAGVFEYDNGVRYYATTRHQQGCSNPFHDLVLGTDGQANLMKYRIEGKHAWRGPRSRTNMHQLEHDRMFEAFRRGEVINNGTYMAYSTLMGILLRQSAYTGQTITWQQMLNSTEDLSPPRYAWDVPLPDPPVPMPGTTPFV